MSDTNKALEERLNSLEARNAVLEEKVLELSTPPAQDKQSISKNTKEVKLTGETFKVGSDEYKCKYPSFLFGAKTVTEADVLADKKLQKELVEKHPGLFAKLTAVIAFLLCIIAPSMASTVTINPTGVEVVSTSFTTRTFYNGDDLIYIYRSSTDAFEIQMKTTRSKVWGGDIDSVSITGASTTSLKLAQLRLFFLETTTTTGYRSFIGRGNLKWEYTASTNVLRLNAASNGQMLWFGHIDSLQVSGVTGATNKLTWLRATANRRYSPGILSGGTAATIAAGAAAGTSPTVAVSGNALAGEITITTGSSTTSTGVIATVTLPITAPTGYRVNLTASNDNGAAAVAQVFATSTTSTIVLNCRGTALTAGGTVYKYFYQAVSY